MKKYTVHIVWLVVAIVALVGGFYYGESSVASSSAVGRFGAFASSTRGGFGGRGAGGGFVAGSILSMDANSLTLQLANGNSQVVFYSTSTSVIKPQPATVKDLSTGTNVMVAGTQNSDGSLTAQSIQVRNGIGGPGGGARAGGGAATGTNSAPGSQNPQY